MKVAEINKLKRKAIKEAQRETDKIFLKYSKLIVAEIANQIPEGQKLYSYNGIAKLMDENDKEVSTGIVWSRTAEYNPKMEAIAELQYGTDQDDLMGNFAIPDVIKGKLKNTMFEKLDFHGRQNEEKCINLITNYK